MTSQKHLISDISDIAESLPDIMLRPLTAENYPEARQAYGALVGEMTKNLPDAEGIETVQLTAINKEDGCEVPVFVHRPVERTGPLPCLLWIHGGGYVIGSAESDGHSARQMAVSQNCAVAVVDYRLAPEHPYPAPLHDCYAALDLIMAQAGPLGVNRGKVAVLGISAGDGLAAGLGLLARDKAEHDPCGQVLVYPMLDDTNVAPPAAPDDDFLVCPRASNLFGWQSYLGELFGQTGIPCYAAAARAADLSGLPQTLIVVGDLDLFAEENIAFAGRLTRAGVPTDLHVYAGVCHGFDAIAADSVPAQRCREEIQMFLAKILA